MSDRDTKEILKGLSDKKLLGLLEKELAKVSEGLSLCCAVVNTERDTQRIGVEMMTLIVNELKTRD